jgi:hypothetical protein
MKTDTTIAMIDMKGRVPRQPKFKSHPEDRIPVFNVHATMIIIGTDEMSKYLILIITGSINLANKAHIINRPTKQLLQIIRKHSKRQTILTIPPQIIIIGVAKILLDEQSLNLRDQELCNYQAPNGEMVIRIVMIFHVIHPSYHSPLLAVLLDSLRHPTEALQDTVEGTGRPCNI